ncbi:MAG: SDR family NAD(P)-dependent oxidoreductase, partial [Aquihabitans sp.]
RLPGVESVCAPVDVTDAAAVQTFADRVVAMLGPIDLWVNNAGVLQPMGPQRDHDPDEVDRALLVNIGGVANGTRSFTRHAHIQKAGARTLVNVSSGASTSVYEGWSIYGATKAAVDHFTEIVAMEEPLVGCWSVAPGVVDTDMQATIRAHDQSTFPAVERFRQLNRARAWNSPEWVADHLLAIHTGQLVPDSVIYRIPAQPH